MKIILFSPIHIRDKANAEERTPQLIDWRARSRAAFDEPPQMFLADSAMPNNLLPVDCPMIFANVPDTKPYDPNYWTYASVAADVAFSHVMQQEFDLCVINAADAILGVSIHDIADEFMKRPEVICGPGWFGNPDTHILLLKREAVIDILYSTPFTPLCKVGRNGVGWEEWLTIVFCNRWWNPWPEIQTVRQSWYHPPVGTDIESEIMKWPILCDTNPVMAERYRIAHPLTNATNRKEVQ